MIKFIPTINCNISEYAGIIEYEDGSRTYLLGGKRHREDGPAIIRKDGRKEWFLNDNNITEEVNDWVKENNIPEVWNNSHKLLFKLTFG